jgi:soluble lytic murein transglycosylase
MIRPAPPLFALLIALAGPATAQVDADARRQALRFAETGKLNEARYLIDAPSDPMFDKVLRWLDWTRARGGADFAEIARFIDEHPHWPNQPGLRKRAEELARVGGDPAAVLAFFAKHPATTRDGRWAEADALRAQGRDAEAQRLARAIWSEETFGAVEEADFLRGWSAAIGREDDARRLDHLLWRGQTDAARRQMARVDGPARDLAEARLRFQAGAAATGPQGTEAALGRLSAGQRGDPGLVFDRARRARRTDDWPQARALLLGVTGAPMRPDQWWIERESVARRTADEGDLATAYRLAAGHGLPTGHADLIEAEWLAGWFALRGGDAVLAERHFKRVADMARTTISRSRGAWWAGRAALQRGQAADAKRWDERAASPVTFYGQLAAGRLGRPERLGLPDEPVPTPAATAAFQGIETAQVTRRLLDLGELWRVDPFVLRLAEHAEAPEARRLAAGMALEVGRYDLAALVARRALRDHGDILVGAGWPLLRIESAGPEIALVHALVRQESNFQVDAMSRAGARGLMQLMPATARQTAQRLGVAYDEGRLTRDIGYNTLLGQGFLATVVDQFGGHLPLALAGYNAGPGRTGQWLRQRGDPRTGAIDWIDWIEGIPFTETRGYVQRVLENVGVYRMRLTEGRAATVAPYERAGPGWCVVPCPPRVTGGG